MNNTAGGVVYTVEMSKDNGETWFNAGLTSSLTFDGAERMVEAFSQMMGDEPYLFRTTEEVVTP